MITLTIGIIIGAVLAVKFNDQLQKIKTWLPKPNFKLTRIVKFKTPEGTKYAVRWGIYPFFLYRSLSHYNGWVSRDDSVFGECLSSEERCRDFIERKSNSGEPID